MAGGEVALFYFTNRLISSALTKGIIKFTFKLEDCCIQFIISDISPVNTYVVHYPDSVLSEFNYVSKLKLNFPTGTELGKSNETI